MAALQEVGHPPGALTLRERRTVVKGEAVKRVVCISVLVLIFAMLTPGASFAEPARRFESHDSFTRNNRCTGELIRFEVDSLLIYREDLDNQFMFIANYHIHGTGVGLTSGTQYVFNERGSDAIKLDPGPDLESYSIEVNVISKGSAPNLRFVEVFRNNYQSGLDIFFIGRDCLG
jgi:hypothetical protein